MGQVVPPETSEFQLRVLSLEKQTEPLSQAELFYEGKLILGLLTLSFVFRDCTFPPAFTKVIIKQGVFFLSN